MNDPIRDLPSFKKLRLELAGLEALVRLAGVFRPLLRAMRIDTDQIAATLPKMIELRCQAEELIMLPDRFNDLLVPRGWVMHDYMNVDVAKEATARAEAGEIDGAEHVLVEYLTDEVIGHQIMWLNGARAFRPRIPLAQKARVDYAEGRYHACVPVILMLLDGMVQEATGSHGFMADGADFRAWDSIAAHEKGLVALAKVLTKSRKKTTTDPIFIPYRHGILHGLDLGYDNRMVAAKAWAALFAAGDFVRKIEQGERIAPPEQPRPTWRAIFRQILDTEQAKAQIAAWSPRTTRPGIDIPSTGEPADYGDGTPERALVVFLAGWRTKNYGQMARCLRSVEDHYQVNRQAGELRAFYVSRQLRSYELLEVRDNAPAMTVISVSLSLSQETRVDAIKHDFRLINEDTAGNPEVRGKPGSRWVLYAPYV